MTTVETLSRTESTNHWLDADHEPFPSRETETVCGDCGYAIAPAGSEAWTHAEQE